MGFRLYFFIEILGSMLKVPESSVTDPGIVNIHIISCYDCDVAKRKDGTRMPKR